MMIEIPNIYDISFKNHEDENIEIEMNIEINTYGYDIVLYSDFSIKSIYDANDMDIFELNAISNSITNEENKDISYLIRDDEIFYENLKEIIYTNSIHDVETINTVDKSYQVIINDITIKINE